MVQGEAMTPPIDINEVLAAIERVEEIRTEKNRAPVVSERPAEEIPLIETPPDPLPSESETGLARNILATSTPLHTEDVAEWLGCSTRTVKERARLERIPHRKVAGCRRLVFFESELREWLNGAPLEVEHLKGDGRTVRPVTMRRAA
jgi:predicted DNA-binding transcriptional regulator AlpA